jgi:ferric-dicitrate binding protein FerR (iron transport regulator)
MSTTERDNPLWSAAWAWVMREHEIPLDASARSDLNTWLRANAAHRYAYEEASQLWLMAGLIPPASSDPHDPDSPDNIDTMPG